MNPVRQWALELSTSLVKAGFQAKMGDENLSVVQIAQWFERYMLTGKNELPTQDE